MRPGHGVSARIIINPAVEAEKMKRERRCTARRKKTRVQNRPTFDMVDEC